MAKAIREEVMSLPIIHPQRPSYPRYDLTQIPLVRRLVKHRAFQYAAILPNLFFFALVIASGILGTQVGNANFSIIFVWIVWWALLIILLIPFASRIWCTMCPIPVIGEWTQRAGVIRRKPGRLLGLNLTWPKPLRNIWVQNLSFVAVAVFSGLILTRPVVTGWLLLGFMVIALGLALVFQRRAFCRYVCPVGGFIGLYSMAAPMEIRVKDPEVCLKHCAAEC
ncbi:MAG: 4Fe-4S binding protein, partial [Chloroflexi bacterium]|nr:4Fe-4S binding protein [Chloroflexota bacterium]